MDTKIMPELERQESAAERRNQQGQGREILTPNQMLSRLPISLAQLQAGNNSEKLKNETRQLLYSLYRSKNMTKQVYNNLMKPIRIKNIIIPHKMFVQLFHSHCHCHSYFYYYYYYYYYCYYYYYYYYCCYYY